MHKIHGGVGWQSTECGTSGWVVLRQVGDKKKDLLDKKAAAGQHSICLYNGLQRLLVAPQNGTMGCQAELQRVFAKEGI